MGSCREWFKVMVVWFPWSLLGLLWLLRLRKVARNDPEKALEMLTEVVLRREVKQR